MSHPNYEIICGAPRPHPCEVYRKTEEGKADVFFVMAPNHRELYRGPSEDEARKVWDAYNFPSQQPTREA